MGLQISFQHTDFVSSLIFFSVFFIAFGYILSEIAGSYGSTIKLLRNLHNDYYFTFTPTVGIYILANQCLFLVFLLIAILIGMR
jgi:hypothetical protein